MGQAKLRGRFEDRVAEAKSKLEASRPEILVCNNCKAEFTDFDAMDSKGLRGITAVFAGICPNCKQTTFAYQGDPDAVAELMLAHEEFVGGGKIGFQKS
jgi:hypothetical protein